MKKTKEEVIKEAWGEYWDLVSCLVCKHGSLNYQDCIDIFSKSDEYLYFYTNIIKELSLVNFGYDMFTRYIPESLIGIENNNGWIRVESKEDLPNSSMYCWVIDEKGNIRKDLHYNYVYKVFQETFPYIKNVKVTHYQPIVKPKPPLY